MRVPARVSAILAISLAVLAGFGARRLIARQQSARGRAIAFAALVALVAIDLHPALELVRVWPEPPPIYSGLAGDRDGWCWRRSRSSTKVPGITDNIQYMYFSLWHWRPMINGYSGFTTPAYQQLLEDMADFPGAARDRRAARPWRHPRQRQLLLRRRQLPGAARRARRPPGLPRSCDRPVAGQPGAVVHVRALTGRSRSQQWQMADAQMADGSCENNQLGPALFRLPCMMRF